MVREKRMSERWEIEIMKWVGWRGGRGLRLVQSKKACREGKGREKRYSIATRRNTQEGKGKVAFFV